MQGRQFERGAERLGSEKTTFAVPATFCARSFINDFRCAKEDKEYNQCEKGRLPNPRLPIMELQQNEIYTEDHLVYLSRAVLVATREISASEENYASYCKTDFGSSTQPEYI